MPYLTDLADVLRRGGITVWESPGWKTRGHGAMRSVQGILCHHTAGGGSSDWLTVQNGRPGLDGPLAQMTLERDGTVRVLAAGQSWHAGTGSHPSLPGASNATLIGIEGVSPGTGSSPWTPVQVATYPRVCAALCRGYNLPASKVLGHFEWATPRGRKIDPWSPTGGRPWDMDQFRADVARLISGTPEEDMFDDNDRAKLDTVVNQLTGSYPPKAWDFPGFRIPLYDVPEAEQPTFTPMEAVAALCIKTLSRLDRDVPSDVAEDLRGDVLNIGARLKALEASFEEMKTAILAALASDTTVAAGAASGSGAVNP